MPKKKYIDKKKAVSFHLVHRSQRDPLQADDDAPTRILMPSADGADKRREEQRKYGVFYDDDYDYLQHLKDVDELRDVAPGEAVWLEIPREDADVDKKEPTLNLPSSIFASEVETETGLLAKAVPIRGPRPDWDPDIVAGLEEDFDYDDPDNILDDDFISKANAGDGIDDIMADIQGQQRVSFNGDEEDYDYPSDEADNLSDAGSYGDQMWEEEETKSRFTSYSLTSSVIRRNEGLTLLDNRFEKVFEQYEDEEIGALDHEEIEGALSEKNDLMEDILQEFEETQKKQPLRRLDLGDVDMEQVMADDDNDNLVNMEVEEPKEKWDCESILSTYSNLYNHPKLIEEPKKQNTIKLTKRLGIPANILPDRGPTQKQIEKEIHLENQFDKATTYRPKDESLEEKKMRKQAIKEERKFRRMEKKANKNAFKMEQTRQEKEVMNLQNNLKGIKMT